MRLIDADELIEVIEKEKDDNDYICGLCMESTKDIINEQPTAFDVKKVVEQLEDEMYSESKNAIFGKHHKQKAKGLERAIEIVKRGQIG